MVMAGPRTEADARTALRSVVDPDLPFLTIEDIAILRDVDVADDGGVRVVITPTYSGCPAMDVITQDIVSALTSAGFTDVCVDVAYAPAWTTDWLSDEARSKLVANRIAPPGPLGVVDEVLCPSCESDLVRTVSEFGSTACKSIMVCTSCGEPFDHFKSI